MPPKRPSLISLMSTRYRVLGTRIAHSSVTGMSRIWRMQACPDGICPVSSIPGDISNATFRPPTLFHTIPLTVSCTLFLRFSSSFHGVWRSTSLAFIGHLLPRCVNKILQASQTFHSTPPRHPSTEPHSFRKALTLASSPNSVPARRRVLLRLQVID